MRRVLPLLVFTLALAAGRADALTIRDIIELSRAGLGEDILLALIDVERRVFPVDPDTIKKLKHAGVPEPVIVAIVRSGRMPPPEPVPVEPRITEAEPQVIVIDHGSPPPTTIVREVAVPVAVPIYVPVAVPVARVRRSRLVSVHPTVQLDGTIPHAPIGLPHARMGLPPEPQTKPEPVYWGWGGKLRPDAWKPN